MFSESDIQVRMGRSSSAQRIVRLRPRQVQGRLLGSGYRCSRTPSVAAALSERRPADLAGLWVGTHLMAAPALVKNWSSSCRDKQRSPGAVASAGRSLRGTEPNTPEWPTSQSDPCRLTTSISGASRERHKRAAGPAIAPWSPSNAASDVRRSPCRQPGQSRLCRADPGTPSGQALRNAQAAFGMFRRADAAHFRIVVANRTLSPAQR